MTATDKDLNLRRIHQIRETEHQNFQKTVQELQSKVVVKPINEKFASKKSTEEEKLGAETVGLSTLDEFSLKRKRIESGKEKDNEQPVKKPKTQSKLTFSYDEGGEEEETEKP